jgi:hypothetical protein
MKSIQWGIFVFLVALIADARTSLSGEIGDVTFIKDGNPYIVDSNLTVLRNKTVTIEEGCIFLFKQFAGIEVNGNLVVNGTSESPVVFVSINDSGYNAESTQQPNPFDWNGILLSDSAQKVVLSHFILKHSVYGLKSLVKDIVIKSGTFSQNGQYNFALNEVLMPALDKVPFSYGDSVKIHEDKPNDSGKAVKNAATVKKGKNHFWQITGVTCAITAVTVPIVYFIMNKSEGKPDSTLVTFQ